MGEVITPGCFAGSSGTGSRPGSVTSAAPAGARDDAGAPPCVWRATRTRSPSRSNSISLSPVSSSSRASSRTISGSIASFSLFLFLRSPVMSSALAARADQRGQPVDRERVAGNAEAAQAGLGHRGDVGMMAKTLARETIADMDFDHGQRDCGNRIADGDRRVGITARIDDDPRGPLGGGLVDEVHDFALMVLLP